MRGAFKAAASGLKIENIWLSRERVFVMREDLLVFIMNVAWMSGNERRVVKYESTWSVRVGEG